MDDFYKLVQYDGIWIDMNEVSNFCDGQCDEHGNTKTPEVKDKYNYPPYAINNKQAKEILSSKTTSMDAVLVDGTLAYNAHSLYGLSEAVATKYALEKASTKRSFIISRSTFPGSGRVTGHWTGDNTATWDQMYLSIAGMLNMQMFGIPLVGSDICGFNGNTTEELCLRWMQMGAFYPFSRNHNTLGALSQEPYRWESVAAASRAALSVRYSLLPYYYTLFHLANVQGGTVMNALVFLFPEDVNTHGNDRQFMIGDGVLVSPVLEEGATAVDAYFPKGLWYDLYTYEVLASDGQTVTLKAPLDHINLHVQGGRIVPMQTPALTTAAALRLPREILVALNEHGQAAGSLYLDDGISQDTSLSYLFVRYAAAGNWLRGVPIVNTYADAAKSTLGRARILGLAATPKRVVVNGKAAQFTFDGETRVLVVDLNLPANSPFYMTWF
eukprot:Colp12_sorted_trinity150504_noHs@1339